MKKSIVPSSWFLVLGSGFVYGSLFLVLCSSLAAAEEKPSTRNQEPRTANQELRTKNEGLPASGRNVSAFGKSALLSGRIGLRGSCQPPRQSARAKQRHLPSQR